MNETHYHNCPYCKTTYACSDGCYTSRVNNRICATCRTKWEKQLRDIKEHGTDWHRGESYP